jgi:hypothetical protein
MRTTSGSASRIEAPGLPPERGRSTLAEWLRVARRYVFIVLPHHCKEDRDLDLTPAEELFDRYRECFDTEEDWHWQRWTSETFRDLCERLGVRIVDLQDPDDKRGNGFAVVLDASRSPRLPPTRKRQDHSGQQGFP